MSWQESQQGSNAAWQKQIVLLSDDRKVFSSHWVAGRKQCSVQGWGSDGRICRQTTHAAATCHLFTLGNLPASTSICSKRLYATDLRLATAAAYASVSLHRTHSAATSTTFNSPRRQVMITLHFFISVAGMELECSLTSWHTLQAATWRYGTRSLSGRRVSAAVASQMLWQCNHGCQVRRALPSCSTDSSSL
jgi:hypothetical protein